MLNYSKRKNILIKNIINNDNCVRDNFKVLFDVFGNVDVTTYQEALMTDIIYYYINNNNYKDFKCYYDTYITPIPYFYIFVDNNIINDNIFYFNIDNIKAEVFGALLLNILFPLLHKYKVYINIDNIDKLYIIPNVNVNFIINGRSKNIFTNIFGDNLERLYYMDETFGFNNNELYYSEFIEEYKINGFTPFNGFTAFNGVIYNLIHDTLVNDISSLFNLFYYDFVIFIKNKDSTAIIISNDFIRREEFFDYNKFYFRKCVNSNINTLYYNYDLSLNDFLIEYYYYNSYQKINLFMITINNDQLFRYDNIIKPWAHKNIYPKINNIHIYKYSGICNVIDNHIIDEKYTSYIKYKNQLLKIYSNGIRRYKCL